MRGAHLVGCALLALVVAPASASADSKMTVSGGVLYFVNEDAGIANALSVDHDGKGRLHFVDVADPYGMNFPSPPCSPGRLNGAGNVVEVFCEKKGYTSVTINSGPGEDRVAWAVDEVPVTLSGGVGADTLGAAGGYDTVNGGQGNDDLGGGAGNDQVLGEDGDDVLRGGAGEDRVNGGLGADTIDAGDGNDTVQASDGWGDVVDCGTGEDTAVVDQADTVTNCERLTRENVTPPAGATSAQKDTTRPSVSVGGSTLQRITPARRRVTLLVTASERALVQVSGFLEAGGINSRLTPASATVSVGGGGVAVPVTLSKRLAALVTRDLKRRRHPKLRFTVSAADAAGNTSRSRHLTVALQR